MDNRLEFLALLVSAVLGGLETVIARGVWRGEAPRYRELWKDRFLAPAAAVWFILLAGVWYVSAWKAQALAGVLPQAGYLFWPRVLLLVGTYLLLALVDGKHRIVPDAVLLCYLAGELLMAVAGQAISVWGLMLVRGAVFAVALLIFFRLVRGKMGMGDAKLLGVTAMTAGVSYTIRLIIFGMGFAFVYGIWLLLVKKQNIWTEIPFVPFLTAGMVVQLLL